MGKWDLFRIDRDKAIKNFVKAKKKVLGLQKLVLHMRKS